MARLSLISQPGPAASTAGLTGEPSVDISTMLPQPDRGLRDLVVRTAVCRPSF
jgi:hypothetical protein